MTLIKHFLCSRLGFAGFIYIYIYKLDPQSKPVQRKLWLVWPSIFYRVFPIAQQIKNPPAMQGCRFDSWVRKIPGGGNGNPFLYFCLENPRTEKPGGLQSMGLESFRHNWATKHSWAHIRVQALFTDVYTEIPLLSNSTVWYKIAPTIWSCSSTQWQEHIFECGLDPDPLVKQDLTFLLSSHLMGF